MRRPARRRPALTWGLTAAVLCLGWLCGPPVAAQSLGRQVNDSIARGRAALLGHQRDDGAFGFFGRDTGHYGQYPMGYTALAVYTLRKAGVPADDPALKRALGFLRGLPTLKVYSAANLVFALDAVDDPELLPWLFEVADWLAEQVDERSSLWDYPGGAPDLSNTQFAALALSIAVRRGHPVDADLWLTAIAGALACQNDDGGFQYRPDETQPSTGTMTTAGLTTLLVAQAALERAGLHAGARRDAQAAIDRGWAWFDRCFTAAGTPMGPAGVLVDRYPEFGRQDFYHYYYLYGVERVASLAGRSRLAGMDWYAEGARELLAHQSSDGTWGHFESTCFALLFLRRVTISGAPAPLPADVAEEPADTPPAAVVERGPPPSDGFREDWAYTLDEPRKGWQKTSFDDSRWSRGTASFASPGASGAELGTPWTTGSELWIRKRFHWAGPAPANLTLWVLHDDEVMVWIDGVAALHGPTWSLGRFTAFTVEPDARAQLDDGEHVLAAYCRDTGGERSLDVRMSDPGPGRDALSEHWLSSLPLRGVPWIRSWWLADGGVAADDLALMLPAGPPAWQAGARSGWSPSTPADGTLVWEGGRKPGLAWASTWLHVEQAARGWLWLGTAGGFRAWLDGQPVASRHQHRPLAADTDRVALDLAPGVHRLSVLVEVPTGGSGLTARLTDSLGRPLPGVLTDLAASADALDRDRAARLAPELFGLDELATRLPLCEPADLRFDEAASLDHWAVRGASAGSPAWRGRGPDKTDRASPHPGRRGWVRLMPSPQGEPLQLIARIPPATRATLQLSPAATLGQPDARVRLGAVADEGLSWLAETSLSAGGKARRQGWTTLEASLPAGTRLVVVEVEGPGEVFLDELSLDAR